MKYNFVIGLLLLSLSVRGEQAEPCPLESLKDYSYLDLECNFYLGTLAYRHGNYEVAAGHWRYVIDSEPEYESDPALQSRAKGTLNYLTYYGLGVEQNRVLAVSNWVSAAREGSFEARRHLGIAFSDKNFEEYNLTTALAWYLTVDLLYQDESQVEEDNINIYRDVQKDIIDIKSQMKAKQIDKALTLAKSYMD